MRDLFERVQAYCLALGLIGTVIGAYQCVSGCIYSVAAQHEATTVGQFLEVVSAGRGGHAYHYEFSVNGVKVNDYSDVCDTPITPDACYHRGQPVLVYYSYQPFTNSRLEDFAVASAHAYRIGVPILAIGLCLIALTCVGIAIWQKEKHDDDSDPDDEEGTNSSGEVPDVIHVVRREYAGVQVETSRECEPLTADRFIADC